MNKVAARAVGFRTGRHRRTYLRALADASKGEQAKDLRRLARAHRTRKITKLSRRVVRRSDFGPLLSALMHGVDERVSIPGLDHGTNMVERILNAVATG